MEEKGFSKDLNTIMQFPKEGIYSTFNLNSDIVHVIKGKGKFVLFDKEIEMKPGVFIFMPKDAPHSLKANEDLAMLLILTG